MVQVNILPILAVNLYAEAEDPSLNMSLNSALPLLLQAIRSHPHTQEVVQTNTAEALEQNADTTAVPSEVASASSEATDASTLDDGIISTEAFRSKILSPAKRMALMFRSQKKMLLWDVVLSQQSS